MVDFVGCIAIVLSMFLGDTIREYLGRSEEREEAGHCLHKHDSKQE